MKNFSFANVDFYFVQKFGNELYEAYVCGSPPILRVNKLQIGKNHVSKFNRRSNFRGKRVKLAIAVSLN